MRATLQFWLERISWRRPPRSICKSDGNRLQLVGNGETTGVVRALWRFDASARHIATDTLRPISMHQVDDDAQENGHTTCPSDRTV